MLWQTYQIKYRIKQNHISKMDVSDTVQQQRAGPSFSLSYLFGNFIQTLHFTAAPINQCLFLMNTTQPNAQCSCLNHLQLPQLLRVNGILLSSIAACSICPLPAFPPFIQGHSVNISSVSIPFQFVLNPDVSSDFHIIPSLPTGPPSFLFLPKTLLDNLKISTTHTCLLLSLTIILQ